MNEEDRKKVFWLLKKYSSYTAWNALGEAYSEFAAAFEYAIEHYVKMSPTSTQEQVDNAIRDLSDWYKEILDGQIAFEKGLPLLKEGQRSVFRNTSTGYLRYAGGVRGFIRRIMDPEEFVFDWMPNKDEVVGAANKLWREPFKGLALINERDENHQVASLGSQTVFDPIYGPFNIPLRLSAVPTPTDITIQTEDDDVPQSGIWEPEWEISPGLLKSLTGTPVKTEKGCMNYLLAGTIAPKYKDGELEPEINVTWRLIWADDRYLDGIIPEEEAGYIAEVAQPQDQPAAGTHRGLPDEIVPQTGWWWSPAFTGTDAFRYFTQNDHFPPTKTTNYGGVIWYYEADRQKEPPEKR